MSGSTSRTQTPLTALARLGFANLEIAAKQTAAFTPEQRDVFGVAADPDQALKYLNQLFERDPGLTDSIRTDLPCLKNLVRLLGASSGIAEFLRRRPEEVSRLISGEPVLPNEHRIRQEFARDLRGLNGDEAAVSLRIVYRRILSEIALFDLSHPEPLSQIEPITASLSDLSGATIDAAIGIAKSELGSDAKLAVIGMGKAGARELNYLSDVDVIYVVEPREEESPEHAVREASELARRIVSIISGPLPEPALWELDANLRPEGKSGALVRTLESHLNYYEKWAKGWEFQALLKARPLAGDFDLGTRFVNGVAPLVWASASGSSFVESVQRMRERVTAHIPASEKDVQIKLGEGGLRDIEFTTQLLQLVHGQTDERVRVRGTLPALRALCEFGYIGRGETAAFIKDYESLRLLEHRLQLSKLKRTHLMPRQEPELRVLARATGLANSAIELRNTWLEIKAEVHSLHERLFYRPLLSAVASLPEENFALTSEQAQARLAAIGFKDPAGALRHIAALTEGLSRRATIQRNLLPVLLQWFAEGADPDHGLLVFRRLSESLGESHWYLRMLRDSSGAAHRLTTVLASSRFVGDLFERTPEAVAWLENDSDLEPRPLSQLLEETESLISRYSTEPENAVIAIRQIRRREVLRLATASILGLLEISHQGKALADLDTLFIQSMLSIALASEAHPSDFEFAVIAMGRFGGAELGFGSDADVLYVYRANDAEQGQASAEAVISRLNQLVEDFQLPFDLDINLRPEGKNGPVARSLDSYRAYYSRWSLTWEAQALLRAKGVAGSKQLIEDFESLADEVRYPKNLSNSDIREIRRIKARVESERLPKGADPSRHLKLGRGSLSDIEWLVQLFQLQHALTNEHFRTTSTLEALAAATGAGLVSTTEANILRGAWMMASRCRSAMTLWNSKTSDVLPTDRAELDGIARLLGYPNHSATKLEDDYLRATRRARAVFERHFFEDQTP